MKGTHAQFNYQVKVSDSNYARTCTPKERRNKGKTYIYDYDVSIISKSHREATKRIRAIYAGDPGAKIKFTGIEQHDFELDQYVDTYNKTAHYKRKRRDYARIRKAFKNG